MASSPSLRHRDSQETLISLAELDPSPIDSPEDELVLSEYSLGSSTPTPGTPHRSSPTSVGLGSNGRGPIFYLTRLQRYSSYTFTLFASLHFTNTAIIPLVYRSVPYSEPFLLMTRELYQTRISEPLVVGLPVVAHVLSGMAIRVLRRNQNKKRYRGHSNPGTWSLEEAKSTLPLSSSYKSGSRIWPIFSNIAASGYVFAVFLTSHVAMNRILPMLVDGDSSNIGLGFVAHGFARHAPSAYAAYTILLSVGTGHMVWGMARWLDFAPPANWKKMTFERTARRRQSRAWWTIQVTAVSLIAAWAAGGLGVVAQAGPAQGWLAGVYNNIYEVAGR